jgi:transcriptional regulator GlxA family with amidase domain
MPTSRNRPHEVSAAEQREAWPGRIEPSTSARPTSAPLGSRDVRLEAARRSRRLMVQRASEFLLSHAAEGVRIGELSRLAGMSERALRNAFHREHGLSPKQFDLRERLQSVRRALCDGPVSRTVTTVASEFGFFELGRFARIYKRAFGESPSQTIKTRSLAMRTAS